jgi:hypothetical protein
MKPTGFYRFLWYKGDRHHGLKRGYNKKGKQFARPRKDKQWNRIMKRSERHIFREYLRFNLHE